MEWFEYIQALPTLNLLSMEPWAMAPHGANTHGSFCFEGSGMEGKWCHGLNKIMYESKQYHAHDISG